MTPNWSQEVYVTAWNFATKAHEGQTYAGHAKGERIPYINHISRVAMEVIYSLNVDFSLNGNLAIQCALLHDTIEDTKVDFKTIETHFGFDVAQGVDALSKNKNYPTKREQMLDSLHKIQLQPKEIWMVKLADRITNLSPPPFLWDKEKCEAYRQEALLIHEYLHEANELLSKRLLTRIEAYKIYT